MRAGLQRAGLWGVCVGGGWDVGGCMCGGGGGVCVWVHWWLSGIHSELPIERLVVQGPASGNLVLSFFSKQQWLQ